MPMDLTIQKPPVFDALIQAGATGVRNSFRRAVENTMRPRMNRLRDQVRQETLYPAFAKGFHVVQHTEEDSVTFGLLQDHDAYRFAYQGSEPHVIEQAPHMVPLDKLIVWAESLGLDERVARIAQARIAERGVIIEHPGIEPDIPVQEAVDNAMQELAEAGHTAVDRWVSRLAESL